MSTSSRIFFYTFLFLCALAAVLSFVRFVVYNDYVVEYEVPCNPATEQCFVSPSDTTGETSYYMKVQKYAPDVYAECGKDVVECAQAGVCLPTDRECSVTYCSPDTALADEQCAPASEAAATQP